MLKLYGYWRSSATYRLRIALNLKGVEFIEVPVNLHPDFKEQESASYRALNPQMRVPAIEIDGQVIGQSMAILEWIEETWPEPALLPKDAVERLQCRAFADIIACDIHPLNNVSVLGTLRSEFGADGAAVSKWYADWIVKGFAALETLARTRKADFLFGDTPGLAEVCLIPQIYNARRFDVDLSEFPTLTALEAKCLAFKPFADAVPEAVKPD